MKKSKKLICAAVACAALSSMILWGNNSIGISRYTVKNSSIPAAFSGFRIVQVSDFHNTLFGKDHSSLISLIEKCNADIIVITGDLIDSRRTDIDCALSFIEAATQLAPVYYVTGNHEARVADYPRLKTGLEAAGVTVLDGKSVPLTRNGAQITLAGMGDPNFIEDYQSGGFVEELEEKILSALDGAEGYSILLSHRPELFDIYVSCGVGLVFTGHAHGGQFRLPFVGGVFAPSQGPFPEYDAGVFSKDGTDMVVSRGLGNSVFPLRLNNRPELVCVTLENSETV